jgi:hypothetical protein
MLVVVFNRVATEIVINLISMHNFFHDTSFFKVQAYKYFLR